MNVRGIAASAGTIVALAAVAVVVRPLVRRLAGVSGDIVTTARQLATEPESVQDGALQQRFRLRRAAVAAMRADLLKMVRAESLFTADSGYPTSTLLPPYLPLASPGNIIESPRLTSHGWWTTVYNVNLSIACAVAVGGDTTIGDAPQGQPVCFDGAQLGPVPTTREQCAPKYSYHWDQEHRVCRRATL